MGLMSKYVIEVYALSGVVVRANDFRKDLRLVGYSYYSRIEFNVVVGIKGDSMDRYLVRMNESLESVKTLNKCIRTLTTWYLSYTEVYGHVLTNMESMIHYFKLVTEGYTFTLGQTYLRQESPKGELGCYIVHGQTTHPCRVSIRTPDYTNLQAVHVLSTDHYVADLIATLGTADIVLGSVDKIFTNMLQLDNYPSLNSHCQQEFLVNNPLLAHTAGLLSLVPDFDLRFPWLKYPTRRLKYIN